MEEQDGRKQVVEAEGKHVPSEDVLGLEEVVVVVDAEALRKFCY